MRDHTSTTATALAAVVIFLFQPRLMAAESASPEQHDLVRGNLIQFIENGAWSWFQDERAVVDAERGKLIVGSVANRFGAGGPPRDGDIDITIFDLGDGSRGTFTAKQNFTSYGGGDDHNLPAFLVLPNGDYLAVYAGHNNDKFSYYRIYADGEWGPEQSFNWETSPSSADFPATYSNLFHLADEGRVYNIARTDRRSPNLMLSTNLGESWSYGGQLTSPDVSVGYVNGYFKYFGNGVDRIDFVCTEHHPRDFNTSIYHGYVKDEKSFKSDGTVVDEDISDKDAPRPEDFTRVFAAGTEVNGIRMTRCWTIDLQGYPDGTLAAIFKARANNSDRDHRFFHARFNGKQWASTYLGKAGPKLFGREEDYTGLGALDPNDPSTIYISAKVDPRDDSELAAFEIFKGVTRDNGSTWSWTAITRNSTRDNLRPIVPSWDAHNTALLWWRGTSRSSQNYDAAVVGLIERGLEKTGPMTFVNATPDNTRLATGEPLPAAEPSFTPGDLRPERDSVSRSTNKWHHRAGVGNGGSVLASSETGGEDAPPLATRVPVNDAGTYDIWINFWGKPGADWRIKAGLSAEETHLFRQMASQQVERGFHDTAVVLSNNDGACLYQAYLGRVDVSANGAFDVYVDDEAIPVGAIDNLSGDTARTWYDGVSYAKVSRAEP